MIIQGQDNTYDCRFVTFGPGYAQVQLQIPEVKTYLFGLIKVPGLKCVWQSSGEETHTLAWAQKLTPIRLEHWYLEVVREYESYLRAWQVKSVEEAVLKEKTFTPR